MEEPILLSGPCGTYCTNYYAEVVAIQKTLDTIHHHLEERRLRVGTCGDFKNSTEI